MFVLMLNKWITISLLSMLNTLSSLLSLISTSMASIACVMLSLFDLMSFNTAVFKASCNATKENKNTTELSQLESQETTKIFLLNRNFLITGYTAGVGFG